MALVTEKIKETYDLSQIQAGDLFYGRHRTWKEGKSGIVTTANEKELIVQYHPGISNVTNHFRIPANEVFAGEWEARWSHDLSVVHEYTTEESSDGNEKLELEQEETDESGATDL